MTALLTVSILPLAMMGVGAWVVFGRLLENKSRELQTTIVENHARSIETYFNERINLLKIIVETENQEALTKSDAIRGFLEKLNAVGEPGFSDLGVIGEDGKHLAYIGPYELLDKNYAETGWFKQVMAQGQYMSDVFLGFRGVPHIIIAVKASNAQGNWILRATIDSDRLERFVRTGMMGETGDAYLINTAGLYQTSPRSGKILEASGLKHLEYFSGVRTKKILSNGATKIQATSWIPGKDWMLVVEQDAAEVRGPVNRAIGNGALLAVICVTLIIITTFLATRFLIGKIFRANAQREEMFKAFMRSAKLASIGELATGLAHEINNPLAIISADSTNIGDIMFELKVDGANRDELQTSLQRIKRQVERCKGITTKMLQFGRSRETELKPTEIKPHLQEITAMMQRQAKVRNVDLQINVEEGLPKITLDPLELEQVLVNLITNAFQAMSAGGRIIVSAGSTGREVVIKVSDTGSGIDRDNLERIFEPFFTTKPVGQGTGLGLSVCYGIVQSWGGKIYAESEKGRGTKIVIAIPHTSGK